MSSMKRKGEKVNGLKSTLQVIAFRGLNNINISCAESAFNTCNIFVQHVEILGMNKFFYKMYVP